MNILIKLIFALMAAILIYTGIYGYTLSQVKIDDFGVEGIQNVGSQGYSLAGSVKVTNGGLVPVMIKGIDYTFALDSGERLAEGSLPGTEIRTGQSSIPFKADISWRPTATTGLQLVTQEHVYANLDSTVHVAYLGIFDIPVDFRQQMDIKSYITEFVKQQIGGIDGIL